MAGPGDMFAAISIPRGSIRLVVRHVSDDVRAPYLSDQPLKPLTRRSRSEILPIFFQCHGKDGLKGNALLCRYLDDKPSHALRQHRSNQQWRVRHHVLEMAQFTPQNRAQRVTSAVGEITLPCYADYNRQHCRIVAAFFD